MVNIDNIMVIHGRIVRDPELKENNNGVKYVKFTVAVDRRGKNSDVTDFVDCVAFGTSAENIAKYFRKGKAIRVSGSMECDVYTAKDGTKRYPWALKVDGWGFDAADPKNTGTKQEAFEEVTEDIPF